MSRRGAWTAALLAAATLGTASPAVAESPNTDTGQGSLPAAKATPGPKPPGPAVTVAPPRVTAPPVVTAAPPPAAQPGRPAPARKAVPRGPTSRALRRRIGSRTNCIPTIPDAQQSVIVRRAGVLGFEPGTRAQVARKLHLSAAQVARREHAALRTLRKHDCGKKSTATSTATPAAAAPGSRGALAAAAQPARSYAKDHPTLFFVAVGIALLCAILLVGEIRRSFRTTARGGRRSGRPGTSA